MGGILLETQANRNGLDVVIGIGLNLGMAKVDENIVTQAWADLSQYHFDRNELVCRLAYELQKISKFTRLSASLIMPNVGKASTFSATKRLSSLPKPKKSMAFRKVLTSREN